MLTAIPQGLAEVSTIQKIALGSRFESQGKEYIYLKGIGSTAIGSWVNFLEDGTTALMTKALVDKLQPLAIAMAAIVASSYGWYQIYGEVTNMLVLASCAKEVAIYSSATGGSADDDSTSQTKLNRAIVRTTRGGTNGLTAGFIAYPSAA